MIAKILTSSALLAMGAGTALAATPAKAPAKASAKVAPKAAATQEAPAQVQDAMLYLKVLISGLQSDKVEQPVKGALVGCLYNNSLGKITESMDKVIAENPGKIDRNNPSELLGVMVRICGYTPEASAAAPAPGLAPAPAPAPSGNAPVGR